MARVATREKASRPPGLLNVSRKALRTVDPPISRLIAQALKTPGLISFAVGLVDEPSLPAKETLELCQRVLSDETTARAALQYGETVGLKPLREALLRHVESLEGKSAAEMGFTTEEILITTGSQQVLYLLGDALLDEGDIVIAADPSYFVYTGALASLGARVLGVPMDEQGMRVEEVDRLLSRLKRTGELSRVKFIYCTSFFQNPTGLTLSLDRRKRLLEIAKKYSSSHRILILEDAAYRELDYAGKGKGTRGLPSIKSFDPANEYTVLTQTFSKPFAPGIRTGYTILPRDLMDVVVRQKGNHDFGSANLCQWLALEAMRSGAYRKHVARLCKSYRAKRDRMLKALETMMPKHPELTWTKPDGGLYVWMTLPKPLCTGPGGGLFEKCLEEGVLYVPGEYAFGGDGPKNQLRLCFGQVAAGQIEEGVRRLATAVSHMLGADVSSKTKISRPTAASRRGR